MPLDKYTAIWLSHSSIKDFLNCPRAYYLKNIYKNPKTRRKINLMTPPLALGQIIHQVIDDIAALPVEERLQTPLQTRFDTLWKRVYGKKGGFKSEKQEEIFISRGKEMIDRIQKHPGPILKKAVKIKGDLPYFWLSEVDNLILCGKIDWLEYLEKTDSIHIIDFKTGKVDEGADSLQLPIYYLLVKQTQSRPIAKVSYWYLDRSDKLTAIDLPDEGEARKKIMEIALRIKLARQLALFKCAVDERLGCFHCAPFSAIVDGMGEFVGVGQYNEEIYILPDQAVSL